MRLSSFFRLEEAGAFQNDVDALFAVRQIGGITFAGHGNGFAVHDDRIVTHFDRAGEAAMCAVELEQERV